MKTEIKFTTSATRSKLMEGQVFYVGQLSHNLVRTPEETREAFTRYANLPPYLVTAAVDALFAFICEELAQGNRLDFGPFSVGLKMGGRFAAANAPFVDGPHAVVVELTPGKALKTAVRALQPVNATDDGGLKLTRNQQVSPFLAEDAIATTGERLLIAAGCAFTPLAGVWLENDAGLKLAEGEIVSSSDGHCRYRVTAPVPAGLHWLVLGKTFNGALCTVRRRITARETSA